MGRWGSRLHFTFLVPVQSENGPTHWFRGERHASCMAGMSIYNFVGFQLQRERAFPDPRTNSPVVCCRPLVGDRYRWLLVENEFQPCGAPDHESGEQ